MLWHGRGKLATCLAWEVLSSFLLVVLLWTWSFWYDSDSFSMDSSEVRWHPSSSLIFIFYHFRLGHDGACLVAQILWRWVVVSSSVFSFCYSGLYVTSLLFSMTCLLPQVVQCCIVISISFFLIFVLFFLDTLLMSVISVFCSFVVISFCSFS